MYSSTFFHGLLATALIPLTDGRVVVEIHDVRITDTDSPIDGSNLITSLTKDYTQKPICPQAYGSCKSCCTCYYNEYGYQDYNCNCGNPWDSKQKICLSAMKGRSCKCPGPKKQDLDLIETNPSSDQIPMEESERVSYNSPEGDANIQGLLICPRFSDGKFKNEAAARSFCINKCACAKAKTGKGWETHCTKGTKEENNRCYQSCNFKTCP
ncbi:hypothetical protein RAB80_003756 [Fusarium oxysporum f. sp. vasinfectum]|nr:hypothetical protein RAB80_003756 [Fusarium oxysporum f. sp. vasinfectum]KAK2933602.1 hypothetical protein FoTM2_004845 [Fusarium oxysporum f. sp. vasinfectum]